MWIFFITFKRLNKKYLTFLSDICVDYFTVRYAFRLDFASCERDCVMSGYIYCFGDLFSKIGFGVLKRILETGLLRRCVSNYSAISVMTHWV